MVNYHTTSKSDLKLFMDQSERGPSRACYGHLLCLIFIATPLFPKGRIDLLFSVAKIRKLPIAIQTEVSKVAGVRRGKHMNNHIDHSSVANVASFPPVICPVCRKAFTRRTAIQSVCGLNCFAVMQKRLQRNNTQCKQARLLEYSDSAAISQSGP